MVVGVRWHPDDGGPEKDEPTGLRVLLGEMGPLGDCEVGDIVDAPGEDGRPRFCVLIRGCWYWCCWYERSGSVGATIVGAAWTRGMNSPRGPGVDEL